MARKLKFILALFSGNSVIFHSQTTNGMYTGKPGEAKVILVSSAKIKEWEQSIENKDLFLHLF